MNKKCPYCAEEIKEAAIVCKHCGRDLIKKKKKQAPGTAVAGIGLGLIAVNILFGIVFSMMNRSYRPVLEDPFTYVCTGIGFFLVMVGVLMKTFSTKTS